MYSKADKKRAIELFYQYHHSWSAVVRELGYPSLGALKRWIKDYEQDAKAALGDTPRKRKPKYSNEQRQAAVDHFFEHGQFITKTVKALGYPSRQLLREWLLADPRCDTSLRNRTVVAKPTTPDDVKVKAVEALYKRAVPAKKLRMNLGLAAKHFTVGSKIYSVKASQLNRRLVHQVMKRIEKTSLQKFQISKLVLKSLSFKTTFSCR